MPNQPKGLAKRNKRVQDLINNISHGMDTLYKHTYMASPINTKDLDSVSTSFNKSLDKILNNNYNKSGESNLSKLFSRSVGTDKNSGTTDIIDLFEDKSFMDSLISDFTNQRQLKELDEEIDQILTFMPMLEDALDAKKDNVLSADNFSRDYINIVNDADNINEEFDKNIKQIKEEYNLLDISEYCYDMASKYGEAFLYVDSYKDALFKLIKNKPNALSPQNETFAKEYKSPDIICEKVNLESFGTKNIGSDFNVSLLEGNTELFIEMNKTGSIESAIKGTQKATKIKNKTIPTKMEKVVDDKLSFEGLGSEGIIDYDKSKEENKNNNLKVNGSIIKKLPRENTIPLYIDDIVLGYYYIECDSEIIMTERNQYSTMNNGRENLIKQQQKKLQEEQKERLLKTLSASISNYIDSNFINNNQDLKEEIYIILKHNDMFNGGNINKIRVSFIPPENMIHYYFKLDPITHRGISDLQKSLLPAKIYVYLYLNDTIGNLTRSQDKRMYSVKNSVDTNISQVLLNTINQLKKSNMGARELTSMKTMLNITGRYNDVIIPVGPSGESPIDFQVMEGQNIETKTDLMEMMQEMAVNATDVPYEYVQSRKTVDYAVRLTMSNAKFIRKTFKRQAIVQKHLSKLVTILYNNEFNENTNLNVLLPPPGFLQTINNNQLYETVNQQVSLILEMKLTDDDDPRLRKKLQMKLMEHYLKGYLDMDLIERLVRESKMEFQAELDNETEEE